MSKDARTEDNFIFKDGERNILKLLYLGKAGEKKL